MRRLAALVMIATMLLVAQPAQPAPVSAPRATRLAALLARIASTARAPGGVMVVTESGRIWRSTFGVSDRRGRIPMPPNARFRVASVTKMFVATVVLQLVAEGKLRLDEPIGRVLVGQVFGAGTVTLRELLNHTSGFYDGGPLVPVPGTFHYDNTNYALLGEVVEAVTGMTVRQALVLRVFRPLRLAGTLWPTSATPPRLARGYSPRGADVTPLAPQELSSADAIVSTADDLRRFVTALVSGRLLAPEQLAEMEAAVDVGKPYRPIDDRYGLGLMRYESTCGSIWGHRGRIAGYTTFAFASPFGPRSVVVLLNVGRVSDAAVVRLNSLVFAALCA